ncbi:DUF2497 domain-containing protein [Rhizobium sp. CRIBSB]|nr:DUF2497 domain-containing protein [Rhizobium sp. CRIBSB]
MTDQTAQEPTMEEILASIRRIISEDDAPAETAPAPAPVPEAVAAPAPAPVPAPVVTAPVEDDVLELTDRYEAPSAETIGDLDVSTPEEPMAYSPPEPEPFPMVHAAPEPDTEALVGDTAAASAASAFAGLTAALRKPDPVEVPTGGVGPTIDDLARALLKPMLKDWLDENLPGIVDAAVRKEVERIARSAG